MKQGRGSTGAMLVVIGKMPSYSATKYAVPYAIISPISVSFTLPLKTILLSIY